LYNNAIIIDFRCRIYHSIVGDIVVKVQVHTKGKMYHVSTIICKLCFEFIHKWNMLSTCRVWGRTIWSYEN